MKRVDTARSAALRNLFALCASVLAGVVIFFPTWYGPENELHMKGAIALSLCAIFYVEWRRGMLSLPPSEMHAEVRRHGMQAFGWARPLPLLAIFLSIAAHVLTMLRA